MNEAQKVAIENHCRFAFETARPEFGHIYEGTGGGSLVLSVNSGYE